MISFLLSQFYSIFHHFFFFARRLIYYVILYLNHIDKIKIVESILRKESDTKIKCLEYYNFVWIHILITFFLFKRFKLRLQSLQRYIFFNLVKPKDNICILICMLAVFSYMLLICIHPINVHNLNAFTRKTVLQEERWFPVLSVVTIHTNGNAIITVFLLPLHSSVHFLPFSYFPIRLSQINSWWYCDDDDAFSIHSHHLY